MDFALSIAGSQLLESGALLCTFQRPQSLVLSVSAFPLWLLLLCVPVLLALQSVPFAPSRILPRSDSPVPRDSVPCQARAPSRSVSAHSLRCYRSRPRRVQSCRAFQDARKYPTPTDALSGRRSSPALAGNSLA